MFSYFYLWIAYEFKKNYPGQRNAVKMTFDFHFSPPNTVIEIINYVEDFLLSKRLDLMHKYIYASEKEWQNSFYFFLSSHIKYP